MTLGNPGQVIHPGIMYGYFAAWDGEPYSKESVPFIYAQATDETAAVVETMSDEVVAVAAEVCEKSAGALDLSGVLGVHEWFKLSYGKQTGDTATLATCFRTGPLYESTAPMIEANGVLVPNFRYRYLSEDVPFGLAVVRAIAQLAGVQTPAIDTVIRWAQSKIDKRYLLDGKVGGSDALALPLPQNYAIETIAGLVQWYAPHAAAAVGLEQAEAV
jgi:hypothetical protein